MSSIEKWLTGITVLAVVATGVASAYTAPIIGSVFGGIAKVYTAAKA